jgi:lysophospholipase L1-like esterase
MELGVLSVRISAGALLCAACAGSAAPAPPLPEPAAPTREAAVPGSADSGSAEAPADAPVRDAGPPPPPTSETASPELPRGTTVLHIGDSMAGALGLELNAELAKAGVRGVLRVKTASYIPTWAGGTELPMLLAAHKPDLVIVTLGANELRLLAPERRAELIRKLVGRFDGRPCVWIAPPLWTRDNGLLRVIEHNSAPCRYLDTNVLYPNMPRYRDKIHPSIGARKDWARRVVDWLARERKPGSALPWELR